MVDLKKEQQMNALHSLIPSWLHREQEYAAMPDEPIPPPPVATLPKPAYASGGIVGDKSAVDPAFSVHNEDLDKEIFGRAAVMLEQLKRDREQAQRREGELQVQLTEALLSREGDTQKVSFLELENAELRNTIAGLQSDVEAYRQFMSSVKKVLDNFGITAPPKKPRNGKPKPEPIPEAITEPAKAEAAPNEQ